MRRGTFSTDDFSILTKCQRIHYPVFDVPVPFGYLCTQLTAKDNGCNRIIQDECKEITDMKTAIPAMEMMGLAYNHVSRYLIIKKHKIW